MPKRGTPSLWWLRILTDFGKDEYVLAGLAALVDRGGYRLTGLARHPAPRCCSVSERGCSSYSSPVAVSNLVTEVLKHCIGRGRPFVGGEANAFHFSHFAGNPAYYSFPSGHATTAFALAFGRVRHMATGARRHGRLCPDHCDEPSGAAGPSSKRRGGGRDGRDRRHGVRAILVCGPAARICDPARRQHCALVGPSSGRLKRVARGAFAP